MKKKFATPAQVIRFSILTIIFLLLTMLLYLGLKTDPGLTADWKWQMLLYPLGMGALLSGLTTLWLAVQTRGEAQIVDVRPRSRVWTAMAYPVAAGALALLCTLLAYIYLGIWPAGDKTVMIVDMHHQYAPLLAQLREMFLSGGNFLYSFKIGLGSSFLPLFAYYLASPFNLLLLLFPESLLTEGIFVITILKNALCAALFAACVQYVYRRRSLAIPIVSVMYALMMYALAYSWNIMWLDCVMMLPLVVLGFERLMRTGKYLLYVLSLAYALYANYYIGFMLCVFMVMYFAAYTISKSRPIEKVGRSFLRFSIGSLLAGGLVMFLLVPVYLALKHTSAAGGTLPELTNTLDMFQILGRHLYDTTPTIRSGNLPNIYCGLLAVVLLPLFATTKSIPLRRRVTYLGLLAVLFLSFVLNQLDMLWHGLHAPNDLPYRFSFLYSFVLLLIAYEMLLHLKDINLKQLAATFVGIVGYLMIEERFGDQEAYGFKTIYISLLLVMVYVLILALTARRRMAIKPAVCLLLLVVTAEMTFNAGNTFKTLNSKEYFTAHTNYVDNERTETLRKAVALAKQKAQAAGDSAFYRMELAQTNRFTCLSPAIFNYRGLSVFASSNYYTTTKFMGNIGYAINGVNSYLYNNFNLPGDSLLGIRYLVTDKEAAGNSALKLLDTVKENGDIFYIYENPQALSIGYAATEQVLDWAEAYYNPIMSQNMLFAALTGDARDLYTFHDVKVDAASVGVGSTSGQYGFTVKPSGDNKQATFTVAILSDGPYYLYVDCGAAESISASCNYSNWDISPHESYILDAGNLNGGDEVSVTVTAKTTDSVTGNIYVVSLNDDVFSEGMETLKAGSLKVETFSDTKITGSFTAAQDGVFFTSIPFDAGWKVRVDGQLVDTLEVANHSLVGFRVKAGTHSVTLEFYPEGLNLGLIISFVSLLALVALVLLSRRRARQPVMAVDGSAVVSVDAELPDALTYPMGDTGSGEEQKAYAPSAEEWASLDPAWQLGANGTRPVPPVADSASQAPAQAQPNDAAVPPATEAFAADHLAAPATSEEPILPEPMSSPEPPTNSTPPAAE